MDIESCIKAYCDLSRIVFSSEHWTNKSKAGKIIGGINATPAFKATDLEAEVKKIAKKWTGSEDTLLYEPGAKCKVSVILRIKGNTS
jgi:hypothetical protein